MPPSKDSRSGDTPKFDKFKEELYKLREDEDFQKAMKGAQAYVKTVVEEDFVPLKVAGFFYLMPEAEKNIVYGELACTNQCRYFFSIENSIATLRRVVEVQEQEQK
jgi:hypothetical protein